MLYRTVMVALLVATMSLIAACSPFGDDDNGDDPEDAEPTAESVLDSAAERWDETQSLHFQLATEGDAYLDSDNTILLLEAEGDLDRPSSVEATARVSVSIATVNVNIIIVDGETYMTNLVSGNWERAPEDFNYNPALLFDPDEGLAPIMRDIREPALDGSESIDGREAHRVTGLVTGEQIEDITAGSIVGDDIDITLWIAEDNYDVVRLLIHSEGPEGGEPTTWDLHFTDHDQDVTIDAPI